MTGYGVAFPKGSKWIRDINGVISDFQTNGTCNNYIIIKPIKNIL